MYLDTSHHTGLDGYFVETTPNLKRDQDHKTSTWEIVSKTKQNGAVRYGDLVYLINQATGKQTYLDTLGRPHSGRDGYGVETTPNLERDQKYTSSTWQIVSKTKIAQRPPANC